MVHEERSYSTLVLMTFIVFFTMFLALPKVQAQTVTGTISRVGDTTHLELRGRKEWVYDSVKKDGSKITVTLPPLDEPTLVQLQGWSCPLIKEIKVNKNALDGKYEIEFQLVANEVESFDYLTDDPSALIFDFFKKSEAKPEAVAATPATGEAPTPGADTSLLENTKKILNKKKRVAKLPEKKTGDEDYKLKERRPAGDEMLNPNPAGKPTTTVNPNEDSEESATNLRYERGVFDGADPTYSRFQVKDYEINDEAIIKSQQNIYVRFPLLAQKLNEFDEMIKTSPEYEIKPDSNPENKDARFILTLFAKNRMGALFETLKYFHTKYPNSKYNEIISNVEAEAHIRLYKRDHDPKDYEKFLSMYEYLIETYPDSVLTERNELLIGYANLSEKDGARTVQLMQKYMLKHPQSEQADKVRMAIAEAYLLLVKPEEAIQAYQEIINKPVDKNYAVESFYRLGDVYFSQKKFAESLQSYTDAQKKYPAYKNVFPNAAYNKAESLFWLGKYKESLEGFVEFLKIFPSHQHGGFALTRVGELLEIMGADNEKIMGAYIEGYFRYPESQGSEVSRIRMLSQELKNMKDREKKHAVAEIDEITKKSTLPKIQEFATLMKADGLSQRSEFKNSLDILIDYYQKNPMTANLNVFKSRILRNVADILREQTSSKQYIDALNFYGKYITTWLKNANRIDVKYFQAYAFEKSGVVKEAEKIYLSILEDLKGISGKREEKERKVYELLPEADRVQLRLAACALYHQNYQQSFKYIKNIKGLLPSEDEIEKIRIGAVVSERMGDIGRAISYLENLVGKYGDKEELLVAARIDLAEMYLKQKKFDKADQHLALVEGVKQSSKEFPDDNWLKTLNLRADWQFRTGQKLASVETYMKLLDQFESKYPLSATRYKAGRILFNEGDIKGAQKIWDQLSDKAGLVYKKMAMEKISQAEWSDTYKKYIDRIPAAESLK